MLYCIDGEQVTGFAGKALQLRLAASVQCEEATAEILFGLARASLSGRLEQTK